MYKNNQLVLHYGNVCQISNMFTNRKNEQCCDLLNIDGTEITVLRSELFPYIGGMSISEFKKKRNSNIFKNRIYINSLVFVFITLLVFIIGFNDIWLFQSK